MKAAVFSFNPPTPDGSLANARTAQWLSDKLRQPLICGPEIEDATDLDVLFMVAGVFMYCRVLPQVARAVETAKHVVWVQNDYTIQPPLPDGNAESPFRKAFRNRRSNGMSDTHFWTTMEKASQRTPLSAYINWNSMAYEPINDETFRFNRANAIPDVFYYGADRAGRQVYFDRYFINPWVPITISSFSKSMQRYSERCDVIPAFPRRAFFDQLGRYSMGLYLEDRKSHAEFTSPATRFYEMLSVGQAMVFQPEAAPMLLKAGYDVTGYIATGPGALPDLLERANDIAAAQRATWGTIPHLERLERAVQTEFKRLKEAI
jgi:hypothetical protein